MTNPALLTVMIKWVLVVGTRVSQLSEVGDQVDPPSVVHDIPHRHQSYHVEKLEQFRPAGTRYQRGQKL